MPPLPTESARPLYEILPEVKVKGTSSSEIYSSSRTYAMPGTQPENVVNISKTIDITKPVAQTTEAANEKEDEKKKKEKKDKYKVKF